MMPVKTEARDMAMADKQEAFDAQAFLGVAEDEAKEIRRDWPLTVAAWGKVCRDSGPVCDEVCQCLAVLIEAMRNDRRATRR
jgi:hypothetical protein